jgi:hypothetical protein
MTLGPEPSIVQLLSLSRQACGERSRTIQAHESYADGILACQALDVTVQPEPGVVIRPLNPKVRCSLPQPVIASERFGGGDINFVSSRIHNHHAVVIPGTLD